MKAKLALLMVSKTNEGRLKAHQCFVKWQESLANITLAGQMAECELNVTSAYTASLDYVPSELPTATYLRCVEICQLATKAHHDSYAMAIDLLQKELARRKAVIRNLQNEIKQAEYAFSSKVRHARSEESEAPLEAQAIFTKKYSRKVYSSGKGTQIIEYKGGIEPYVTGWVVQSLDMLAILLLPVTLILDFFVSIPKMVTYRRRKAAIEAIINNAKSIADGVEEAVKRELETSKSRIGSQLESALVSEQKAEMSLEWLTAKVSS